MLDTKKLTTGMRCMYQGKTLIYQRSITTGKFKTPYHVFKTQQGKEKRLSQPITARDVWVEIETSGDE
jgi:hypothetical protein